MQMSLFAEEAQLDRLSKLGDSLEKLTSLSLPPIDGKDRVLTVSHYRGIIKTHGKVQLTRSRSAEMSGGCLLGMLQYIFRNNALFMNDSSLSFSSSRQRVPQHRRVRELQRQ